MPARTRTPSPDTSVKRLKLENDVKPNFHSSVFIPENLESQAQQYQSSSPYKYCRMDKLFQDDLLESVKDECVKELAFTEKETDIYRVSVVSDQLLN